MIKTNVTCPVCGEKVLAQMENQNGKTLYSVFCPCSNPVVTRESPFDACNDWELAMETWPALPVINLVPPIVTLPPNWPNCPAFAVPQANEPFIDGQPNPMA